MTHQGKGLIRSSQRTRAKEIARAHDDGSHVDECDGFLHARGDEFAGLTLVRDTRRMTVIYDARGSTLLQSKFHDFPGMHRRSVDRAAEEIDVLNDPAPFIEQDQSEHLIIQVAQPRR